MSRCQGPRWGASVHCPLHRLPRDQRLSPLVRKSRWTRPFRLGKAQDWTLPYPDAREGLQHAGRVYAVYDPFQKSDRNHVDLIEAPNLIKLKAFGMGHRTSLVLRRMEQIKPVMQHGIEGTLDEAGFYKMIRSRKDIFVYRQTMEHYLAERGQNDRAARFVAAFKRRKQQKN